MSRLAGFRNGGKVVSPELWKGKSMSLAGRSELTNVEPANRLHYIILSRETSTGGHATFMPPFGLIAVEQEVAYDVSCSAQGRHAHGEELKGSTRGGRWWA